jgi:hypothetical protein
VKHPSSKAKHVHIGSNWRPASFERRSSDGTYQALMRGDDPITGPDQARWEGWFAPVLFLIICLGTAVAVFAHT